MAKGGGGGIYIPPATETECRFPRTNLFSLPSFGGIREKEMRQSHLSPVQIAEEGGESCFSSKTFSSAPAWQHMRCAGGRTLYYATNTWLPPKKASQKELVGEEESDAAAATSIPCGGVRQIRLRSSSSFSSCFRSSSFAYFLLWPEEDKDSPNMRNISKPTRYAYISSAKFYTSKHQVLLFFFRLARLENRVWAVAPPHDCAE